jgi:hypothetical protein
MSAEIIAPAATATTGTLAATRRTAAFGLGPGFVDVQGAPTQFLTVDRGDGFLGFTGISHFYERKSS